MSGSDATLSVDARLNNYVSADVGKMLTDIEGKARAASGKFAGLEVGVQRAGASFSGLNQTMGRASRIAGVTSMAVGSLGGGMGQMSKVAQGASAGIGLFASGLGPAGIAIAGTVILLGMLADHFGKADEAAIAASESGMKKATEAANVIADASKQVVAAQRSAQLAQVGDNPMARLAAQQKWEVDHFKGTNDQKGRLIAAFNIEAKALYEKGATASAEKTRDIEERLLGEEIESSINLRKTGQEREIALLRIQQQKKKAEAIKGGGEVSVVEESIANDTANRIAIIKNKYAEEEKIARQKHIAEVTEASFTLANNTLSIFSAINDTQQVRLKHRTAEHIKLVDTQEKQGILTKRQAEREREKIEKDAARRRHQLAKEAQKLALAEAVLNIAQGITKAFAQGGFLGFLTGAAVAAAGAVQISKIEAQEFAEGGFPALGGSSGTLIRVNEGGQQEAVLNAAATRRLGRENINQLNKGGDTNNSSMANYHYSPMVTVQVTGVDPKEVVRALENQKKEFFTFMEEAGRRGYSRG